VAVVKHRHLDIFQGGSPREQVEALKDEADLFIADVGERIPVKRGNINAIQPVTAAVGRSRQPMVFIKVDLPEPLEPMTATNSPGMISSETPRTA